MFQNREKWMLYVNKRKTYGNSLITRPYMSYKDKSSSFDRFEKLKKLWFGRNVTIIEGSQSFIGVGNDLLSNANSIKRIIAPSIDAFEVYEKIIESSSMIDKEDLILLALGPTATILAHDLTEKGYQALDIGHIDVEYEWYLNQAKSKTLIKGKYVNETGRKIEIGSNGLENDERYLESIVVRID
jgi:glycosyltransferase family protein